MEARKLDEFACAEPLPLRTGLCETCAHRDGCVFPFTPGEDILACEEFDGGPDPDVLPLRRRARPADPAEETVALAGLCSNCANAADCALSARALGAWQCESYE